MNIYKDADSMLRGTIEDCLAGDSIVTEKDSSFEVLNYQAQLLNPRARITNNPARPLNLVTAIARFVWLVGANNRVEDIAFYEPKVRGFSDDGVTVPGSDYGMRLFQPRPGLNQLQGVVDRLRKDSGSRQAAAVVWQPEDAVRQSKDIPCTFGMFFSVRNDHLHCTVTMRSNNAFRILPFNIFEFTMLHELVATELGVQLGVYTHWAHSMHVYDGREMPATKQMLLGEYDSYMMDTMPKTLGSLKPLFQATELARVEASMRHACTSRDLQEAFEVNDLDPVDPYWDNLSAVLYAWNCAKRGYDIDYGPIPDVWREIVQVNCENAYPL